MRLVVGILLFTAAIFKAAGLIKDPASVLVNPLVQWLTPVQIGVEIGIGLLALSGLYWRRLRWFSLLLFALFAAYSFWLATNGNTSCGCFGAIDVHPWWIFALDLVVVSGLIISAWRDRHYSRRHPRGLAENAMRRQLLTGTIVGTSALCVVLLVRYLDTQTVSAADGYIATDYELVILEPDKWIGKPFPIAKFIDLDMGAGQWIIVLHQHKCPECRDVVPRYEALAARLQVVLIEVPPYGAPPRGNSHCKHAKLQDSRQWFVQTPVEIQTNNGIVVSASTELPLLNAFGQ